MALALGYMLTGCTQNMRHIFVVMMDAHEQPEQAWNQDHNNPSAAGELRDEENDRDDGRNNSTKAIQEHFVIPMAVIVQNTTHGANFVLCGQLAGAHQLANA